MLGSVNDRIVALGVEAQQVPGLLHVRRQRRGDVDGSTARMRYRDTPGQEMQLVLHAAGKLVVLDAEILLVADDRVADVLHVSTELVGAAGDRLERQPGELLRRGLD